MKNMTKDDVDVVKHYLDLAYHAVGHAFEAATQAFDVRCENEIDAAITALTMAKGRLNDWPTLRKPVKNFERFADKGGRAALEECEEDPAVMHIAWAFAEWLWCDWSADRLTYLRNMESKRILKTPGYQEIKRLEKKIVKEGGAE